MAKILKRVSCQCAFCGQPFDRRPSGVIGKRFLFCCQEHHYLWKRDKARDGSGKPARYPHTMHVVPKCYIWEARAMLEGKEFRNPCTKLPEVCE